MGNQSDRMASLAEDSLEEQVGTLSSKIDVLQQFTEQLSLKMSQVLSELSLLKTSQVEMRDLQASGDHSGMAQSRHGLFTAAMEHKDVIADSNYPNLEDHTGEQELAPEIQIRRLTAQLTAAYNRIAALEEQLLARRVNH